MATPTTTVVIKAKNDTQAGLNETKSSFQQFTDSLNSLTGGKLSQLQNILTNPFTLASTAIVATGKALKDLTAIGIEARQGFEQLQAAFGDNAWAMDEMLDSIDLTTLATKDQLETMAKAMSQYGLSQEELQRVLQTTADISTTTGKSFETVQSAIISAMNGQDRALTKIIPEWSSYKEGANSATEAITNLGTAIHDSAIKIGTDSLSQTLDNMASNWKNIKDDLGEAIVMQIQGSGVLGTMCELLSKIAGDAGEIKREVVIKQQLENGTSGIDYLIKSGIISQAELAEMLGTKITQRSSAGFDSSAEENLYRYLTQELPNVLSGYNEEFYGFTQEWEYAGIQRNTQAMQDFLDRILAWNEATGYTTWGNKEGFDNFVAVVEAAIGKQYSRFEANFLRPFQDLGLGYAPVGSETVAPNYSAFGVNPLYLNGINGPRISFGIGEDFAGLNWGINQGEDSWARLNQLLENHRNEELAKQKEEADKRFDEVTSEIGSVVGAIQSLTDIWKNGYQAGDIGSSFSAIGGAIGGKWGTILSLIGMGSGLIESWFDIGGSLLDEGVTESNERAGTIASYNGATTVHVNNYFEGANIVGSNGMTELAKILRDELENLSFVNR